MSLEAYIIGCGGMMPLPNRHLTSVLLRRHGELLLFDCGEGTQVSIRSLNLKWKKINAIFISHTHADHITGLPGILMLSAQVERTEPLYIIGPPRIAEYVRASRNILEMYINYEIKVQEIADCTTPQVVYGTDEYEIMAFPLDHTRVCVGYTLVEKPRPGVFYPEKVEALGVPRGALWSQLQHGQSVHNEAGETITSDMVMGPPRSGRKFTYITDSRPFVELREHITGSDLLVCEGMFESEFAEIAAEKGHMTCTDAATLAKISGDVQKMVMVHFSPRYTNRELRLLKEQAQAIFPQSYCGRDGMKIDIPYRD